MMICFVAQSVTVPWYLNPVFLPAATGFLGVIVGGLITAGSSYLLDQRREMREREKEQRDRQREITRAGRLLVNELGKARAMLQACLDSKRYYGYSIAYDAGNWAAHYPILAPELEYEQWAKLCLAAFAFEQVIADYRQSKDTERGTGELSPTVIGFYEQTVKRLNEALAALGDFV